MKFSNTLFAVTLAVASLGIAISAKADTVSARCDVYPKGEDHATSSGLCTFSQRQGFVGIQLQNGQRYDLRPVENQPGNYLDQDGHAAYQQSGLDDKGQIYRLATESIYVYWDTAPYENQTQTTPSQPAAGTPVTIMTRRNNNQIAAQITEGEFKFSGILTRTSGNIFQGSDGRARVIYDRDAGRVTIINPQTGDEFYNYNYTDVNEGRL
jgi:hypothetical protein